MKVKGKHTFELVPEFEGVTTDKLVAVKVTTVNPTVNDDNTLGYYVGYEWVNTTTDTTYNCVDATTGAAVWLSGGATDANAIHDNVAGEINAITEKVTTVNADIFIIEDSADSYNKKKTQKGNLGFATTANIIAANDGDNYGATTGTNTYSVTVPMNVALTTGTILKIKVVNQNTSTCTLTVNALTTKNLTKGDGVALAAYDIPANTLITVMYDGTQWVILNQNQVRRSIVFVTPGNVTSGTGTISVALVTNDRITRELSGTNSSFNYFAEFMLPSDFLKFDTNSYQIDTNRSNAGNTVNVTIGSGGVADATVNALNVGFDASLNTWSTRFVTMTSTYLAGARILMVINITTSGNTLTRISNPIIHYISRN
jgi:hypothetical protein